jgi:hypothetical protein
MPEGLGLEGKTSGDIQSELLSAVQRLQMARERSEAGKAEGRAALLFLSFFLSSLSFFLSFLRANVYARTPCRMSTSRITPRFSAPTR